MMVFFVMAIHPEELINMWIFLNILKMVWKLYVVQILYEMHFVWIKIRIYQWLLGMILLIILIWWCVCHYNHKFIHYYINIVTSFRKVCPYSFHFHVHSVIFKQKFPNKFHHLVYWILMILWEIHSKFLFNKVYQ